MEPSLETQARLRAAEAEERRRQVRLLKLARGGHKMLQASERVLPPITAVTLPEFVPCMLAVTHLAEDETHQVASVPKGLPPGHCPACPQYNYMVWVSGIDNWVYSRHAGSIGNVCKIAFRVGGLTAFCACDECVLVSADESPSSSSLQEGTGGASST